MANYLLVYPEIPPSYWSGKYALDFLGKHAAFPPLGLMTIAALFPRKHHLRLIDMNIERLNDDDLIWCNALFISAMVVQRISFEEVVKRARKLSVPIIAGGPFPSSFYEDIEGVDHIFIGEAEELFPKFLLDFESGQAPKYAGTLPGKSAQKRPDPQLIPLPRYDLIDIKAYVAMSIQFSRGCPYDCEFCDITKLYGRVPRVKTNMQILAELEELYRLNWHDSIFMVDDNFIGNRRKALALLEDIANWQKEHRYPFAFFTETSVNLADDERLLTAMRNAGFNMVFLGIETPNAKALIETNKAHNVNISQPDYLVNSVRKIQKAGMEVSAGFIIGLDGDDETCFDAQFEFIQKTGIPTAMVGLLTALKGTNLYNRLSKQGRIIKESAGNNVSLALNYIPKMDPSQLISQYKDLLSRLYDRNLKNYFSRSYTLIKNWDRSSFSARPLRIMELKAFIKSILRQLFSRQCWPYFKFMSKVAIGRPRLFPEAVRLAIMGYHYQRVTRQQILVDEFCRFVTEEGEKLRKIIKEYAQVSEARKKDIKNSLHEHLSQIRSRYSRIHSDFQTLIAYSLEDFKRSIDGSITQYQLPWKLEIPRFRLVTEL